MPQTSAYYTFLTALQTLIGGLDLTDWNGRSLPVVVRKLPLANETLDAIPSLFVSPAPDPEDVQPFDSETRVKVTYYADLVAVAPGNMDPTTRLDYYLQWREQMRGAISEAALPGLPKLLRLFVRMSPPLDRGAVSSLYDYSAFRVYLENIETA